MRAKGCRLCRARSGVYADTRMTLGESPEVVTRVLPLADPAIKLDIFLKRGLAGHYKEYSDDKRLADDENHARLKKLRLWGGSHKVIAPWDWRKMSKDERDEFR